MPCGRRRFHLRRARGFGQIELKGGHEQRFRIAMGALLAGGSRLHPNWRRSCDAALLAIRFGGAAVEHASAMGNPLLLQEAKTALEDVMKNARRKCS